MIYLDTVITRFVLSLPGKILWIRIGCYIVTFSIAFHCCVILCEIVGA